MDDPVVSPLEVGLLQPTSSEVWLVDALESLTEFNRQLQSDLPKGGGPAEVFGLSLPLLRRLATFEAVSLYRPDEEGLMFDLVAADPPSKRSYMEEEMLHQVQEGQFSWALYQSRGVVVPAGEPGKWTLLHAMHSGDRVEGMLIMVLDEPVFGQPDLGLKVLSVLLEGWSSAISRGRLNRELDRRARTLEAEVKRQTEELRKSEEEARLANAAKDEFLARISHEIRSPLGGILGTAGLLLEAPLDPDERMRAETIYRSSELALEIVNEILDLARIESGAVELSTVDFDLHEQFDDVMALLGPKAAEKRVGFRLDWDHATPRYVHGDPLRLRQIVLNLCSNAIKFTEEGDVRVCVSSGRAKDEVIIRVHDSGVGIPEDRLETIFEKFKQASASTEARFGGTGLGLPISRELAQLMGGTIEASSRPGEGSTFTVQIPLPVADRRPPVVRRTKSEATYVRLDGMRVLLADDDPVGRGIAVVYLGRLGCEVRAVEDGAQALAAAIEDRPDAIVMDCNMPVMDGFESARRIREHYGADAPPIVALTAGGMQIDRDRSAEAGMQLHLVKPLREGELSQVLHTLTEEVAPRPQDEAAPVEDGLVMALVTRDEQVIQERFGADEELVARLTQVFLESWTGSLAQLQEALALEDAEALARVAHRVRGAVSTIGATQLADFLLELEVEWSAGNLERAEWGVQTLAEAVDAFEATLLPALREAS